MSTLDEGEAEERQHPLESQTSLNRLRITLLVTKADNFCCQRLPVETLHSLFLRNNGDTYSAVEQRWLSTEADRGLEQ